MKDWSVSGTGFLRSPRIGVGAAIERLLAEAGQDAVPLIRSCDGRADDALAKGPQLVPLREVVLLNCFRGSLGVGKGLESRPTAGIGALVEEPLACSYNVGSKLEFKSLPPIAIGAVLSVAAP